MTGVPPHDDLIRHPWERLASQYIDGLRDGDGPALDDVTAKAAGSCCARRATRSSASEAGAVTRELL